MKKILLTVIIVLCIIPAFASWYVQDCNVTVDVGRNAVHKVTERYTVNYQTEHHGFIRYIPLNYSQHGLMDARVSKFYCSEPCTVESGSQYFAAQIGSSSQTVTGLKNYLISYNYDLGSDSNNGYDEFYFNIVGDDWDVPFEDVTFDVNIDIPYDQTKVWFTFGRYGSTQQLNYTVTERENGFTVSAHVKNLPEYSALTLRIQLPDGWYQNTRTYWDLRDFFSVATYIVSVLAVVACLLIWSFNGRDSVPIISAKFNPPEGFSPLEVGFIADGAVDNKDITSMLYYWADKGYISINEKKKNVFSFTRIFDLPESAPSYEKMLFDGFFKSEDRNHTVTLESVRDSNFYFCVEKAKAFVARFFTREKPLNDSRCIIYQILCIFLALVSVGCFACAFGAHELYAMDVIPPIVVSGIFEIAVTLVLLHGLFRKYYIRKSNAFMIFLCIVPSVFASLIFYLCTGDAVSSVLTSICCGVCVFFASITSKRSEYGNKVLEGVLGYREFIDKVSMSQLVMLIDKDPEYYYHVLCYAIVLGLENTWAKKFESVTVSPPSWYVGHYYSDVFFYSRMSTRLCSSMASVALANIANAKTVGGAKFGGSSFNFSGFAGGGFGGGGGRGW